MSQRVIVAIRHQALDQIEKLDIGCIEQAFQFPSTGPKQFNLGDNGYSDEELNRYALAEGIVVSHALDTEDALYINNQMMLTATMLSGAKLGQGEATGLESHIAAFRFNARTHKLSVVKNRKPEIPGILKGCAYSVFSIAINDLPELKKNPHAVSDLVHFCRYREVRLRTLSVKGKGINPLGTFKAGQALVVQGGHWPASREVWPSHEFDLTSAEKLAAWSPQRHLETSKMQIEQAVARELAKGQGYTTILKIKAGKV